MASLPWQATSSPGLWLKPVRHDDDAGLYLGLVRFDAGTRSGLHQHQGVAASFVVEGGLTDYHGSIGLHHAGINSRGSRRTTPWRTGPRCWCRGWRRR